MENGTFNRVFSPVLETCSSFVYDSSVFTSTLSTELDLVCDRSDQLNILGTVLMLGLTAGSFLSKAAIFLL